MDDNEKDRCHFCGQEIEELETYTMGKWYIAKSCNCPVSASEFILDGEDGN